MENMMFTHNYTEGNVGAFYIDENEHLKGLSAPAFGLYTQLLASVPVVGDLVDTSKDHPYAFESAETVRELEQAGLVEVCKAVDAPHEVMGYYLPRAGDVHLPFVRPGYSVTVAGHIEWLDHLASAGKCGGWACLTDSQRYLYMRIVSRARDAWFDYWAGEMVELDEPTPQLAQLFKVGALVADASEPSAEQLAGEEPQRYELPWWREFLVTQHHKKLTGAES